jgi:cell division cycle 14
MEKDSSSKSIPPICIIPNQLYWVSSETPPRGVGRAFFFNVDADLKYYPFFKDFGPLNLAQTFRFVTELNKLLNNNEYANCPIYHHTGTRSDYKANAAYLMGAFQVLVLKKSAEEAFKPFEKIKLKPFRDALYLPCTYKHTLLHCLQALQFGVKAGWFSLDSFDVKDYEYYEKVENGDMNWIIPGKFLAFCTPKDQGTDQDGYTHFRPEDYVPIFKKKNVKVVVQLNKPEYNPQGFTNHGIKHKTLYFIDGTTPSEDLVLQFIKLSEETDGAVAVHCKAGLGRTGTMIGMYVMKHYHMPAPAFIAWNRITRPGSVLGPQQQYLCKMQDVRFAEGVKSKSPILNSLDPEMAELTKRFSALDINLEMNEDEKRIQKEGHHGQGEMLTRQRRR